MTVVALKIGRLQLATNLLLAPIAGYTDLPFRLVARSMGGIGLACTDLLCPEGVVREGRNSMWLAATCAEDFPLAMQLYGTDGELLAEAARWAEDHGYAAVDINMGCPAEKITSREGGARLLCDPDRAVRLAEKVANSLHHTPLTVKVRLGWDAHSIVAPALARRLEEVGVAAITVHGRTAEMGFAGKCDLGGIAAVVAAVKSIPVIGNGDIRSPQDAEVMLRRTGCAGVMIGRYALSTPWIFRDTWEHLCGRPIPAEPTLARKCDLMRRHFHSLLSMRHERAAVLEFRQRATWYAKQMNPCRSLREAMRRITSAADFDHAVQQFLESRAGDRAEVDGMGSDSTSAERVLY